MHRSAALVQVKPDAWMQGTSMAFDCAEQYAKDVAKCKRRSGKHNVLVLFKVVFRSAAFLSNACMRFGFLARVVEHAYKHKGVQQGFTAGPHTPKTWQSTKTFGFNTVAQANKFISYIRSHGGKGFSVTAKLTSNRDHFTSMRNKPVAGGYWGLSGGKIYQQK